MWWKAEDPITNFGLLVAVFVYFVFLVIYNLVYVKFQVSGFNGTGPQPLDPGANRNLQQFSQIGYDGRSLDQVRVDNSQLRSNLTGTRDIPVFFQDNDIESKMTSSGLQIQGRSGDNLATSESMMNPTKTQLNDVDYEKSLKGLA